METLNKGTRIWNLGHSGWTTDSFLSDPVTYLDFIDNMQPDLVIVATGTNDTLADYADDVEALMNAIKGVSPNTDLLMWVPYRNNNFSAGKMANIRAKMATMGIPTVDSAVMLNDMLMEGTSWAGFGVHPNLYMAYAVARQLVSYISGDPINQVEKAIATKADLWGAKFPWYYSSSHNYRYHHSDNWSSWNSQGNGRRVQQPECCLW